MYWVCVCHDVDVVDVVVVTCDALLLLELSVYDVDAVASLTCLA